ncbi:hypothetical protein FB000_10257 [Ensifer sp. SEMIA 134]|nr:hypothetical protein FB000_10257 [Ensifer sp. SEMIA 134]
MALETLPVALELMVGMRAPLQQSSMPRYCRLSNDAGEATFRLIFRLGQCRYRLDRPCR